LTEKRFEVFRVKVFGEEEMDGVILTVLHDEFKKMRFSDVTRFMGDKPVLVDVRNIFREEEYNSHRVLCINLAL